MTRRSILLKLQPNQDVTYALEAAARAAGMDQAHIEAALGSLAQGVIERDGQEIVMAGPAIEIASLRGDVLASGNSRLSAYLICEDASVVEGGLVPGLNPVSVTFEVVLVEADAS